MNHTYLFSQCLSFDFYFFFLGLFKSPLMSAGSLSRYLLDQLANFYPLEKFFLDGHLNKGDQK